MKAKIYQMEIELEKIDQLHKEEYCRKLFEIILANKIMDGDVSQVLEVLQKGFPAIMACLKARARDRKWPYD